MECSRLDDILAKNYIKIAVIMETKKTSRAPNKQITICKYIVQLIDKREQELVL
jgi:hypothetical protein